MDALQPRDVPDLGCDEDALPGGLRPDLTQPLVRRTVRQHVKTERSGPASGLDAPGECPEWPALLDVRNEPTVARLLKDPKQPLEAMIPGFGQCDRRRGLGAAVANGNKEVKRVVGFIKGECVNLQ